MNNNNNNKTFQFKVEVSSKTIPAELNCIWFHKIEGHWKSPFNNTAILPSMINSSLSSKEKGKRKEKKKSQYHDDWNISLVSGFIAHNLKLLIHQIFP